MISALLACVCYTPCGPLLVDGGAAPRARRRRPRACPRRTVRPGDGPQPEHRAARLAEDLRPAARRLVEIKQARETLAQIEETTWGLTLREIEGERFVVLPAAALDYPPWTVGGRPAVKLSKWN